MWGHPPATALRLYAWILYCILPFFSRSPKKWICVCECVWTYVHVHAMCRARVLHTLRSSPRRWRRVRRATVARPRRGRTLQRPDPARLSVSSVCDRTVSCGESRLVTCFPASQPTRDALASRAFARVPFRRRALWRSVLCRARSRRLTPAVGGVGWCPRLSSTGGGAGPSLAARRGSTVRGAPLPSAGAFHDYE